MVLDMGTTIDNWLMLKRVEISVFTDNGRAVRLYESLGFVVEGTKRYAAVKNGIHADEYLMARYGKERVITEKNLKKPTP